MMLSPQKFRPEMTDLLVGLHHTIILSSFLDESQSLFCSCKHLIILKDDSFGASFFSRHFFGCVQFYRDGRNIFPPDKVPAPPKKWRLFHSTKRMAKTQESRQWVHFLMLSFWPWFPGPRNWRECALGLGAMRSAMLMLRCDRGCGIVWGEGMLRQRNRPRKKVTWHVRFRWVRILWLRMQGKCH